MLYCNILKEAWTEAEEETSLVYLGNLTGLIHQVQVKIFDESEAGA